MQVRDRQERHTSYVLFLVFVLLAAGIVMAGYFYYRNYRERYRDEVQLKISAVADMKVSELAQYRRERLGNAALFHKNPAFSALVRHYLEAPQDAAPEEQLRRWLTKLQSHYQYDRVFLLDDQLAERMSVPEAPEPIASTLLHSASEAMRSREVIFEDFYRNEYDKHIYLTLLVPILDEEHGGRAIGVLALRIDPEQYLYPFIRNWPTPSQTGETLLVRREGDDVVFLNELRFRADTALALHVSAQKEDLPAAMAVRGRQGLVEGRDYRGVPVIACLRAVPESPWFLVARIDASEALAPVAERLWLTVVLGVALLLSATVGLALLWRQQRLRHYRERYEAAEALFEARQRLESLLAITKTGIDVIDPDFNLQYVDPGWQSVYGDPKERKCYEYFMGLDQPCSTCAIPRAFETKQVQVTEEILPREDNRIIEVHTIPFQDAAGQWLVAELNVDITERKRSEQRIVHLNRVLRAIRDINQLIIRERDPNKLIQETCELLVEHRGYGGALIILTNGTGEAHTYAEAGMGEAFQELDEDLRHGFLPPCCEAATLHSGVCRVTSRTGLCASCALAGRLADNDAVCIRLEHGEQSYGYLLVSVDRVVGFDAEEESLYVEMAGDVAFALHVLEEGNARRRAEEDRGRIETELRQAQKMEAVGRLAGGVAHDFNNMLSVILGYAQAVLEELNPADRIHHDLQQIEKAAQRSADLTRQLLAFSRKQIVAPRVLDLNAAIADSQKMLGRLIGEDIQLDFIPADGLWKIQIDPSQIDQILANLAVNARDAIPDVGTFTIETANIFLDESYSRRKAYVTPGEYVMLVFSDTGAGMDAVTRERIFEPFFTTKEQGKGTGLGLSTVYGIVKQNKGYIHVYSEPTLGTTFRIYFPRFVGEEEDHTVKAPDMPLTGTETILIVEDEEELLGLAKRLLERYGYRVLTANAPGDACLLVEKYEGDIQLLLTDVVMPSMNGKELHERIEKMKPGIKTLYMSGYTANAIAHRGVLDEGVELLHKPFSITSLAGKVREVLDS